MNANLISKLYDSNGWVRYHKTLSHILGVNQTIILGNLIDKYTYWSTRQDKFKEMTGNKFVGQFFITRDYIFQETALSHKQQRTAEITLVEKNVIKRERKGLPSKNHYFINWDILEELLCTEMSYKDTTTSENKEHLEEQEGKPNKNKLNKNKPNKNKPYNIPTDGTAAEAGDPQSDDLKKSSNVGCLEKNNRGNGRSEPNIEGNTCKSSTLEPDKDEWESTSDEEIDFYPNNNTVDSLIDNYNIARKLYGLTPYDISGKHIQNIKAASVDIVNRINDADMIQQWFKYCDTKDTKEHIYEVKSDRSPTVMLNESVFRRFIDYIEIDM